ncbi:MAG: putative peptidase [Prokaryotic dsDNA virus sp.]|nr:MAG: putative peptidase [Prokaryotic dsDNA virus sp.]|tara:strand:- start:5795 stop:7378 length:1584 start_codon:yes stop_codon:yes gene_type:complete
MDIIELLLDEEDEFTGIEAVSLVENPAIEEEWITLSKQEIKFAKVDEEKRILLGAALVPMKPIFRKRNDTMFYVYFSKDTVKRASELFFMNGNQNNATLEHNMEINGLSVVESWIVDNPEMDKSKMYGFDVPEGTWMISMKVENDEVWNDYVKTGKVKGFSIEGYFADKANIQKPNLKAEMEAIEENEAEYMLSNIKNVLTDKKVELESYNDYPDAVSNNAKRGRELNQKVNNKCATNIGKIRSADLASKRKLNVSTIKRMYSFLSRASEYYDESDNTACGTISYLLWGGKAGLRWSESKLKELGEINLASMVINDDFAIIDDRLAYSTQEKAEEMAKNIGCEGFHVHEYEGKDWYMPCEKHIMQKYKCPEGFVKKKGKCVKKKSSYAEIGPRGGIKKSPKAPASGTPNKNPKGKGTAKGDASTSRGAKVSKKDEATLQKKADDFNDRYKKKLGYGVTVGQLKSVFQRGLGAFNVSHSPRIKSPTAWAQARVNAYLYLVRNGRPQNPKYTGDFDLLPAKHPKSPKNK